MELTTPLCWKTMYKATFLNWARKRVSSVVIFERSSAFTRSYSALKKKKMFQWKTNNFFLPSKNPCHQIFCFTCLHVTFFDASLFFSTSFPNNMIKSSSVFISAARLTWREYLVRLISDVVDDETGNHHLRVY